MFTCCVTYYQYEWLGVMSQHLTPAVYFMPIELRVSFSVFHSDTLLSTEKPCPNVFLKTCDPVGSRARILLRVPRRCNIFIQCVMIVTYANQQRWHRKWTIPTGRGRQGEPRRGSRLENNPDSPNKHGLTIFHTKCHLLFIELPCGTTRLFVNVFHCSR